MTDEAIALTPKEAAKLLRLRPNTVRDLCRTGELPARRVGTRFLIAREAVEDWLRAGDEHPARAASARR